MNKPESGINRWSGKSAEDVLAESFHELRDPIYVIVGYMNVLKLGNPSAEQTHYLLDHMSNYVLNAKEIVDTVYEYMNEKKENQ